MKRIFVSSSNITGSFINICDKSTLHYIKDVLRIKKQNRIIIFDEKSNEYSCKIEEYSKDCAKLSINEKKLNMQKTNNEITIACAIPKKAKIDDIIDKLAQLGIDSIIPMMTERVIVRYDAKKSLGRHERWKKISKNASQQAGRINIAGVEKVMDIAEVIAYSSNYDLKLIPTLEGRRKPLRDVIKDVQGKRIFVLIGPEGDFSPKELEEAIYAGFIPVSLGDTVLRVDTAAIAAASFIKLNTE